MGHSRLSGLRDCAGNSIAGCAIRPPFGDTSQRGDSGDIPGAHRGRSEPSRQSPLSVARDAVSLALVVLAYREMGWFAQPHLAHTLEASWVTWDRMALRSGVRAIIESIGPVIPSILEISYTLICAGAVCHRPCCTRNRRAVKWWTSSCSSLPLGCCCATRNSLFGRPIRAPRGKCPVARDLPSYTTPFRRFNIWITKAATASTPACSLAHVAGAFAAAFGASRALPERRWVSRFLFVIASLIAIATVCRRYHYLADALAGLLVALVALGALPKR